MWQSMVFFTTLLRDRVVGLRLKAEASLPAVLVNLQTDDTKIY